MAKKTKKLLFITVILSLLFVTSTYAVLIPNVHAAEITNQQKGLSILSNVVGLDLTKYNATTTLKVNGPTLGTLPTENIRYTLESTRNHVEILEKFTNGHLQIIDVLENSGPFQRTHSPAAVAWMARTFLLNYQSYSANSFYGRLALMLNKADATKNSTTIVGNIKFDITTTSGNSDMGNSTTFTWTYTSNGIAATSKCVSLGYKDGFLRDFIDTWRLHKIGSTTVNLSEKQAEEIAMKNARTFTWSIGSGNQTIVINNFNVTKPMVAHLMFCEAGNASNTRDSDQLALYPMWRIGVGLDKFYPGSVYGISVDIWADTGQVKEIFELISTLATSNGETATIAESSISNQTSTATVLTDSFTAIWITLAPFAVTAIGVFPIWLIRKKTPLRLPKVRKIGATALCILIGLVAFISLVSAVPTVNACAVVWGETSAGDPYLYHTIGEITVQLAISSQIDSWFGSSGYAHHNYETGGQTTKSNVLYYTGYYDQLYPSVETVYFDHGIGMKGVISPPFQNEWHYMVSTDLSQYNNPAENVFDYQIYDTTSDNNYFAYISTCLSANLNDGATFGGTGTYGANQGGSGKIIGMPYAWTHGASISTNGFYNPDSGPYCYIGFVGGSAALCQHIPYPDGTHIYYEFVYHFFDGLLNNQLTVNQALNWAAYHAFPYQGFASTALYTGFTAYWPGCNPPTGDGRMVVYGNGDIYLYSGGPDYVSRPSVSGPTSGDTGVSYEFSASSIDPYGHNIRYTFDWGDGSPQTVTGWYSSGATAYASHSWSSAGGFSVKVKAQCEGGIWSSWSYPYTVEIGDVHWLHVNAYCYPFGYDANPWVEIDGDLVGWAPVCVSVEEGWHTVTVEYQWGYWLLTGFSDGYGNGESRPVYSDTWITAYYG